MRDDAQNHQDEFWNLSDFCPSAKHIAPKGKSVETVEIEIPGDAKPENSSSRQTEQENADSTRLTQAPVLIRREIPSSRNLYEKNTFEDRAESYEPTSSLIRKITLKKWKCNYRYYETFIRDAIRYQGREGTECGYVPFFSYVPQYDQLNPEQLSYYFWWRTNFRRGTYLKTDYSYILLFIYESINLGNRCDTAVTQRLLTDIWNHYHEEYPAISAKLSAWICDYSMIHHLPPAENAGAEIVKYESALKEFYIRMPEGDMEACARSLLKYCCAYDYRNSKFAKGENLAVFDRHILGALIRVLCFFSENGQFLAGFSDGESRMLRDSYAGALCTADEKYRIEIDYYSMSRTNELRYQIGDIVKYAENKIRTLLGVKSRLTVYSVSAELRDCIDRYFAAFQAPIAKAGHRKTETPQAYEALYDLPDKKFSLADAMKIEKDSWGTTYDLVTAFEEEDDTSSEENMTENVPVPETDGMAGTVTEPTAVPDEKETTLPEALGDLLPAVLALLEENVTPLREEAARRGQFTDRLVDTVNDIAFAVIGDILIEEENGVYRILPDYADSLKG